MPVHIGIEVNSDEFVAIPYTPSGVNAHINGKLLNILGIIDEEKCASPVAGLVV